jgi:hypothetical protein
MESVSSTTTWADVVTLGDARFGQLEGGPFDGRCYPLLDGTPTELDVPCEGSADGSPTVRYVLHEGVYRYVEGQAGTRAA